MHDELTPMHPDELPYRAIIERLPVVVYVDSWVGPVPQTKYISPTVETLLGYPPALYLEPGQGWLVTVHPDDLEGMLDKLRAATDEGEAYELQYRFVRPDGQAIWVHDRATPYRVHETGDRGWIGTIEDITARVFAEEALDTSALRYAALLENLPAVVYEMDPDDDRRTRYVNRNIVDLLGYTMDEWLDQPDLWVEVLHPDDRERELAAHDLASATGEPWQREYRLIGADGQVVWVRDQAVLLRNLDGAPTRWQGVMVDITTEKEAQLALATAHDELDFRVRARTAQLQEANELMGIEIAERRRAEQERARAQEHLGYLVHNLPAVVYLWQTHETPDGSWLAFVGEQISPMLGYTPEEWNDGGWRRRVHPHDAEMVNDAARHSIETGEPFNLQYRYLARDGRVVWVHDRATLAQRDQQGETLLFEGVMIDITEMKEVERKAAIAEDRFQEIVEHGPVVLYAFSVEPEEPVRLRLDYLSPQLEDLLGVARSVWQDNPMTWFEMIHPDDRAWILERSQRNSRTGEAWESEYRIIAADGSIKWLVDRGTCVERDADGLPLRFIGVLGDITERREEIAALQHDLELLRPVANEGRVITWSDSYDIETDTSRYTYMSPSVTDILGYTPEELLQESENFPRLVHPDDVERVVATFDRLAPTGQWDDTYRVIARDGTVRWFEAHGWRASPPDEHPQRWHGVTIDVTHRHAAELPAEDAASGGAPAEAPN